MKDTPTPDRRERVSTSRPAYIDFSIRLRASIAELIAALGVYVRARAERIKVEKAA